MPISIELDEQIEQRLEELVKMTGRAKIYFLREAILRGIEDVEDYYHAEAAMERLRKGEERTYTVEEVSKELGLDDRAA